MRHSSTTPPPFQLATFHFWMRINGATAHERIIDFTCFTIAQLCDYRILYSIVVGIRIRGGAAHAQATFSEIVREAIGGTPFAAVHAYTPMSERVTKLMFSCLSPTLDTETDIHETFEKGSVENRLLFDLQSVGFFSKVQNRPIGRPERSVRSITQVRNAP